MITRSAKFFLCLFLALSLCAGSVCLATFAPERHVRCEKSRRMGALLGEKASGPCSLAPCQSQGRRVFLPPESSSRRVERNGQDRPAALAPIACQNLPSLQADTHHILGCPHVLRNASPPLFVVNCALLF